jgi:hypothetical protein
MVWFSLMVFPYPGDIGRRCVRRRVRTHKEKLAAAEAASGRRGPERDALERSIENFRFKVGKRTWQRADLYSRS